ncbi:MAG: AMP-binding protein, partial [Clostridia bacterium]|nr:AMP-binding protein [Clostridia bacterium]
FIVHGSREGWTDLMASAHRYRCELERIHTRCDENMIAYFSSGTTGYPKLVMHRHAYSAAHIFTAKHWHHIGDGTVHLTVSESGWAKCAWGKMFGQLTCGATEFVYDFDRFVPDNVLKVIQDYKVTSFCAPPTMYRFFIKAGLEKFDLSSLKYSCVAGEALSPDVFNKWKQATGLSLMEGFGQTETTLSIANLMGDKHKLGSMGKPSPLYDVDIVDPDGNSVPDGETGEIVIRTDKNIPCGLFTGYYLNDEKTKEVWYDDCYHTGDTAWRDEDGFYWYVGRVDDVIKSSGYRIGPFEIESVIMELPYVLECGVSAAPDEVRGQVVKASIVLTKGTQPSEELKKEIQSYVKNNTAPYKYPRIVVFRDELPKTISGKIQRNKL